VAGRRLPAALFSARVTARAAPRRAATIGEQPHTGDFAQIARCKRALLVTYRRAGTAVPTPVWAGAAGGRLYVRTERASGKVKRLRNDARLLVAPCTVRGEPLGRAIEARARMLTSEQEGPAEHALARRYGLGRALFERAMDALRVDMCFLEIVPGAWDAGEPGRSGSSSPSGPAPAGA
jgi:uncharacterized protein